MNTVATFQKVSYDEFVKAVVSTGIISNMEDAINNDDVRNWYDNIMLPERKTEGAAGYDFHIPMDLYIPSGEYDTVTIPTGIRVKIEPGWFLACFPRSGLGFKYGMSLVNTVGIIDSDYYNANNEGHIIAKVSADHAFDLHQNDRFMQGIFIPYGVSTNGNCDDKRIGGFGSTGAR